MSKRKISFVVYRDLIASLHIIHNQTAKEIAEALLDGMTECIQDAIDSITNKEKVKIKNDLLKQLKEKK